MFDSIYVGPAGTIDGEKLQPKREENYVIEVISPNECWARYKEQKYVVTKFIVADDGTFELEGKFVGDLIGG